MADIRSFRALRYDPRRVPLAEVVTQPYDKITPAMQAGYYGANPFNLVRIILGRKNESDTPTDNVYTRAAAYGREWRQDGISRQDEAPSIYPYAQVFATPAGKKLERRGFIALGRVEDYAAKVVFRHEQTLAKPKADRLELLRATRVHYEQLFLLYEDQGEVDGLLKTASTPDIDVNDEYDVAHRVWQVSDAGVIAAVQERMRDKRLVIADGHHRYETALNFRNECRAAEFPGLAKEARPFDKLRAGSGASAALDAPHEFVMMTFVNMNDPGLLVLPTHRVVHSLKSFSADEFQKAAQAYFSVEKIGAELDAARATALLHERGKSGTALLAVTANQAFSLHSPKDSPRLAGLSERQRSLDVVQLHKNLLEGVLGLSEESIRNQENLSYLREASEALERVRQGSAQIAFLMNPCPVKQVRDVAFAGEVMPQKSTDFYPKLLSGLTAYALDSD
jgi:uncharacterized protein (DUF1015 family)